MAKKTAIKLMIHHFKRLERVASTIDGEQAYHYKVAIEIAELYLKNEENQIIKAYLEGESDGDHLINSAKLYFKKTYGKP